MLLAPAWRFAEGPGRPWRGFSEEFFLYHEDTDLGLRLWLTGHRVGLEPRARCEHEYEFHKGAHKWFYLERNRYATVIRTYPWRVRLAVAPAMLVTELALLVVAARGGWLREKLGAYRAAVRALPRLRRERAAIHDAGTAAGPKATIGAAEFADLLTADLDSDYLGAAARLATAAGGVARLLAVGPPADWNCLRRASAAQRGGRRSRQGESAPSALPAVSAPPGPFLPVGRRSLAA